MTERNDERTEEPPGIIIRLGRSGDVSEILEVRRRTFLHFAPGSYSAREVRTLLSDVRESDFQMMIQNQSLFIAEMPPSKSVVGCGGWLQDSVRHIYVSPDLTRRGIGSALLTTLERDFKDRTHQPSITAGVTLYARKFYEKNGYEFLGLDTDWDGSTFNRMQKRLRGNCS